jgi:hypothetical protein
VVSSAFSNAIPRPILESCAPPMKPPIERTLSPSLSAAKPAPISAAPNLPPVVETSKSAVSKIPPIVSLIPS